jgi:uncharacterized protein (TIGR02145 family)
MKNSNSGNDFPSFQDKVLWLLFIVLLFFTGQVSGQINQQKKVITPASKTTVNKRISKDVVQSMKTTDGSFTVSLSAPSKAQNNVPLNTVFTWTATPPSGLTYDFYLARQRDDDSNGNHQFVLVSQNQTATTFQPALANGEIYYWKVKAKKSDGTTAESGVFFFSTPNEAPSAAVLTYPANGELQVPVTPVFRWQPATDPEMKTVTYFIALSQNSGQYAGYLATSISGNSYTPSTPLIHGETYFWKISAFDDANKSTESEEFSFTVDPVNWSGAITTGSFTDSRDNKTYRTVTIGQKEWMAENLALLPAVNNVQNADLSMFKIYDYSGTDVAAAKNTENYRTYGVLYNWTAAQQVCPAGWHLPTDSEWNMLLGYLGMTDADLAMNNSPSSDIIADKLREQGSAHWTFTPPTVNNSGKFNALPAGWATNYGYTNIGTGTVWWTSTLDNTEGIATRGLSCTQNSVCRTYRQRTIVNPWSFFSVRCVKD